MSETGSIPQEALPRPEEKLPYTPLVGAQLRLALDPQYIDPSQNIPTEITPHDIPPLAERNYDMFNNASSRSRATDTQELVDKGTIPPNISEQKTKWIQNTTRMLSSENHRMKMQTLTPFFSKVLETPVDPATLTEDQIKKFYEKFFENKNLKPYEVSDPNTSKVFIPSDIKSFVTIVLDAHTKNGTFEIQELRASLPEYRWLARMFGKEMQEAVVQLIDMEAKVRTNKDALIREIDPINKKRKAETINLTPEEKKMLSYISQHGKSKKTEVSSTPPSPNTSVQNSQEQIQQEEHRKKISELIDYKSGQLKEGELDLSGSFSSLVDRVQKLIDNNDPSIRQTKNEIVILSDEAKEMVRQFAAEAAKSGKRLAISLQGVEKKLQDGTRINVVSYVIPASDYSLNSDNDIGINPLMISQKMKDMSKKTHLDEYFKTNSRYKNETGDILGVYILNNGSIGEQLKGIPDTKAFLSNLNTIQNHDSGLSRDESKDDEEQTKNTYNKQEYIAWGVLTRENEGFHIYTSHDQKTVGEPPYIRPKTSLLGEALLYNTPILAQKGNELYNYGLTLTDQTDESKKVGYVDESKKPEPPFPWDKITGVSEKQLKTYKVIQKKISESHAAKKGLPVYVPFAGGNFIEPMLMTNSDTYVFVDPRYVDVEGKVNDGLDKTIESRGIKILNTSIQGTLGKGGKRIIEFEFGGKKRKIIQYAEDPWQKDAIVPFKPSELNNGVSLSYRDKVVDFITIKDPDKDNKLDKIANSKEYKFHSISSVPEGGFLSFRVSYQLPASMLGFKQLKEAGFEDDIPIFQKTEYVPNIDKLALVDNLFQRALMYRWGEVTESITDTNSDMYRKSLTNMKTVFDTLPLEQKQQIYPLLYERLFVGPHPQEIELYKQVGLTDSEKINEYAEKNRQAAFSIFPELKNFTPPPSS